MNSYRTHTCSELRAANIGKPTTLIGWVDSVRDHGGVIFIDLRDRSGITQVVFHPEVNQDVAKASQQLRSEDMIQISGTVAARLKTDTVDTTNADLPTGEIEVSADTLNVINKADVLPFQLDRALSNEDLRLKYRFLTCAALPWPATCRSATASPKPRATIWTSTAFWKLKRPSSPNPRRKAHGTSWCPPPGARQILRAAPGPAAIQAAAHGGWHGTLFPNCPLLP